MLQTLSVFCLLINNILLLSYIQIRLLESEYLGETSETDTGPNSLQTCRRLADLLGSPLSSLMDVALLFYVGPISHVFLAPCLPAASKIGAKWTTRPCDCYPDRNTNSLDADIKLTLDRLRASLRSYKTHQLGRIHEIRKSLAPFWVGAGSIVGRALDQLQQFLSRPHHLDRSRPVTLTPECYARTSRLMGLISYKFMLVLSLTSLAFSSSHVLFPWLGRCPQGDCVPWQLLSSPELLLVAGVAVTFVCCTPLGTENMVLSLMLNQLELVKSLDGELLECKRMLLASSKTSACCCHATESSKGARVPSRRRPQNSATSLWAPLA